MIVELLSWGPTVGLGANGARFCTVGGVAKFDSAESEYLVANEFIALRLAMLLSLPVPPGTLVRDADGNVGFLSLYVGKKGEAAPPTIPQHFAADRKDLAAAIVVFDSWIRNNDRHPHNLAYSRAGKIAPLVFDHDRALLGTFKERGALHLKQTVNDPCEVHCLGKHVRDEAHVAVAIDAVRRLPEGFIQGIAYEAGAAGLLSSQEWMGVVEFLLTRRDRLSDLVAAVTPNITQRSFLLQ